MKSTNPEIDQDRVEDTVEHFNKFGYIMFPEQLRIYDYIAAHVHKNEQVLEVGCGNGIGTARLQHIAECTNLTATDKLRRNVDFAACLYPWIEFEQWDITDPHAEGLPVSADHIIAVEIIEHVANPAYGLQNLRRRLDSLSGTLWVSTPNGRDKPSPPDNPYHVHEYTPSEILDLFYASGFNPEYYSFTIKDCDKFETQDIGTHCNPLLYVVQRKN